MNKTGINREKVLIVGDIGIGKSSLLLRYVNDAFFDEVDITIG